MVVWSRPKKDDINKRNAMYFSEHTVCGDVIINQSTLHMTV